MTTVRFGTDGVRGEAGRWPITAEGAVRVGRAAAALAAGGRVVVVSDPRPSSGMLVAGAVAGIAAGGATAIRGGVLPTAAVPVAIEAGLAEIGVAITASHNPAADNGFKVFGPGGRKPDEALTAHIEDLLAAPPVEGPPGVVRDGAVAETYRRRLVAAFGDVQALAGRRIGLDTANGAASGLVDWLGTVTPAEWVPLGDGTGAINDGCGAVHPAALAAQVRDAGLDAGIALDGDADRCVLVDDTGTVVPGDALTWRLARSRGVRGLAVTVMSNAALEGLLPGVAIHRTPVGDRHLQIALDAHGLDLGAEESGHVLFPDFPGGDGLLTGVRALVACWTAADRVADALAGYRAFPRRTGAIRVARRPDLASLPGHDAIVALGASRLDGGRVFLRYSGTEPVLRVLVEGPDADVVDEVYDAVVRWAGEVLA